MATKYLSTTRFLKGKTLSAFESIAGMAKKSVSSIHPGYSFVGSTKAINFRQGSSVGIFKNKEGDRYFIKDYAYALKNLEYEYLHNEINTLQFLEGRVVPNLKVRVVKLIEAKDVGGRITLITKLTKGKNLDAYSASTIENVLINVVSYLRKVSKTVSKAKLNTLPKRSQFLTYLTFPFYLLRAISKEPKEFKLFKKSLDLFLRFSPSLMFRVFPYSITHRDLSSDNILYDPKSEYATIIDPECAVLTDNLFDLALLPRLYIQFLKSSQFMSLIESQHLDNTERKRLIVLMLAGCLIKIATEKKGTRDYVNAVKGLTLVVNKLIPQIAKKL